MDFSNLDDWINKMVRAESPWLEVSSVLKTMKTLCPSFSLVP
jgi:hypothetical protein